MENLEELEQVNTNALEELNNITLAFERNDFNAVINQGNQLLTNPTLSDLERGELLKMITISNEILNKKDNNFKI